MKQKIKNNKGITLIALVLTIIILIILAGISISILTGQDGLITKAKQGAQNYQNSAVEEQAMLNTIGAYTGGIYTAPDRNNGGTGSETVTANQGGTGKVYYLGTGTTFDIPTLLPDIDYTQLTADNFIVGISSKSSASASYTPSGTSKQTYTATGTALSITKSYNSSTGTLTLGGYTENVTVVSTSGGTGTTTTNCTCFVYVVLGEIETI